ncbi:MAG: hypothetical protein M1142_03230 [Patescibacteria group bacterium]|nr:hypothetical protein [Patescibacteria group bacterium]
MKVRNYLISNIKISQSNSSDTFFPNYSPPPNISDTASDSAFPTNAPSPVDHSVLGIFTNPTSSNDIGSTDELPTPTTIAPSPTPTPTPAPITETTTTTTNTSPSSSCTGTPNADNSQVYINPSSSAVNTVVNVVVELRDCNNNDVSSDNLTMSLVSGDSSTTINNSSVSSPYQAQAQNGRYTFIVNSQKPGANTFNIQDTSRNFPVTMPGYHTPTVTFTSTDSVNSSCTADGDAEWSNAYFPSGPVNVGSNATITIDLRDCHNQTTLGSDTLTVTPNSVDPTFQFVGYGNGAFTLPQGQTSFQVTSQNAGSNTFTIKDTTNGFNVTGPHYSSPSVTFASSPLSPSPTPSATPTPSSSPAQTPTPTPDLSVSPTPTLSPVPSITPTPSLYPSPT